MQNKFNADNTTGHTAAEIAKLNRRYNARIKTYIETYGEGGMIRTGSDPHFFGPISIEDYVARLVLTEFNDD